MKNLSNKKPSFAIVLITLFILAACGILSSRMRFDIGFIPTLLLGIIICAIVMMGLLLLKFQRTYYQTVYAAEMESERKYRELVEHANSIILRWTRNGNITFMNEFGQKFFGYSEAEIIGQHVVGTIVPETESTGRDLAPLMEQILADPKAFESNINENMLKNGERVWIAWTNKTVMDENGDIKEVLSIGTDITSRRHSEEALKKSESLYHDLVETSQDLIWQCDKKGRYIYLNPAWEEKFGYTLDEMMGKKFTDFESPEQAEKDMKMFLILLQKEIVKDYETVHIGKPGNDIHLVFNAKVVKDDNGKIVGTRGTAYDITARNRAEEEIRKRNLELAAISDEKARLLDQNQIQLERIHALYAVSREMTRSLNLPEVARNVVQSCVETFGARLAWVGQAEPDGRVTLLTYFPADIEYPSGIDVRWDDTPEGRGPTGQAIRNNSPSVFADLSQIPDYIPWRAAALADGLCTSAAFPLYSHDRSFGVLNLYSDQTGFFSEDRVVFIQSFANQAAVALENAWLYEELQQNAAILEQRVKERTEKLEAANRELETFSYSVSHDLKAPLRGIDGYSRLLLEEYSDKLDDDGRMFVHTIRGAVIQMNQLIEDLLAYSRIEKRPVQSVTVNLHSLIRSILESYKDEFAARNISVILDVPQAEVLGDLQGLAMVIRNLIDNAVKFTAPVSAPEIRISGKETETSVVLEVKDNGIGFDMKFHDRIFHIFQRLHRAEDFPGTGIGLAIVQKAISRMGGNVRAESEPGKGATFYIEIRRAL